MKIGSKLNVTPSYFNLAFQAVFEIGVKLGHVLWRKFLPEHIQEADVHLNSVSYNLITAGHLDLAIKLLSFGTEVIKKHYNESIRKTMVINKALAYYLKGNNTEKERILKNEDFSIGNDFKLACAVLMEDYENAISYMDKLGSKDERVDKNAYREWPLFMNFRGSDEFKNKYREIFGEDFVFQEVQEKSLVKLLKNIERKKEKNKKGNSTPKTE